MKPKVLIIVKDGMIQSVFANADADVHVADYDDPSFDAYPPDEVLSDEKFKTLKAYHLTEIADMLSKRDAHHTHNGNNRP
jgi:hypothetical protein